MAWKFENVLGSLGLGHTPSFGIALGGGGARGFAHIGVLRAFEKFGIRPDILSGVSAGSIAAVLYAAGLTPSEMLECFEQHSKFTDFTEWTIPKTAFLKMTKFSRMFESWLPVKYLEQLLIRTCVCATDLDHGKSVGWFKGEIVPRVVASCSIPIVFPPVDINGINYVDGGVLRNLPAWAIRRHCSVLYGVNCSPLRREDSYNDSILGIAYRSYKLMSKANMLQDASLCDHIIHVKQVSQYSTFGIDHMRTIMNHGYEAACHVLETSLNKKK